MTHTDPRYRETRLRERKGMVRKILSYIYSFVDTVIGFFVVWTFFSMLRVVVGMSTDIFWLSKALIQQVSFILMALIMCIVVLVAQWLFERAMNRKNTWVPKSFMVVTGVLLAVYAAFKLVVLYY